MERFELVVATGDHQDVYNFSNVGAALIRMAAEVTLNNDVTCEVHDLEQSLTVAVYTPAGVE